MQDHPRRSASNPADLFKTCALFLAVALLLSAASFGQTVVVQTQNGTTGIRGSGYSAYGYPWSALAASDREQYVSVFAEVDHIAAWSGNGSTVTFTAIIISLRMMLSRSTMERPPDGLSIGLFTRLSRPHRLPLR